jgi:hypothetical protein
MKFKFPDFINKFIIDFINNYTFIYKNIQQDNIQQDNIQQDNVIQQNDNIQQGGNNYHKKYLKYKFKYNSIK